jgi:hypothetical protein
MCRAVDPAMLYEQQQARATAFTHRQIACTLLRTLASMLLVPISPRIIRAACAAANAADPDAAAGDGWDDARYNSTLQFAGVCTVISR